MKIFVLIEILESELVLHENIFIHEIENAFDNVFDWLEFLYYVVNFLVDFIIFTVRVCIIIYLLVFFALVLGLLRPNFQFGQFQLLPFGLDIFERLSSLGFNTQCKQAYLVNVLQRFENDIFLVLKNDILKAAVYLQEIN